MYKILETLYKKKGIKTIREHKRTWGSLGQGRQSERREWMKETRPKPATSAPQSLEVASASCWVAASILKMCTRWRTYITYELCSTGFSQTGKVHQIKMLFSGWNSFIPSQVQDAYRAVKNDFMGMDERIPPTELRVNKTASRKDLRRLPHCDAHLCDWQMKGLGEILNCDCSSSHSEVGSWEARSLTPA